MAVTPTNNVYRWSLLGVDLKTEGTTGREMVAAVAGKKFVMTDLIVVQNTAVGSEMQAYLSVGVGSSHNGDLYGGETGFGITQLADPVVEHSLHTIDGLSGYNQVDVGTNGIWLKVVDGATGTTFTADVHLFGFYR